MSQCKYKKYETFSVSYLTHDVVVAPQTTTMVGKIILGLGQVLSKQPDVLQSKELIEQFKDQPWLQFLSFNFG